MRFGGIVLAVLLTLGACSSDPEPKEPKRTATSASPTATPPTMPPQAKKDTPSGAATFVGHYIALVNFAANTGETGPMAEASSDCEPCDSYLAEFNKRPTNGERFSGVFWKLTGASVSRKRDPLEVEAKVSVREGKATRPYTFVFVLTKAAPFSVTDIYMPEDG